MSGKVFLVAGLGFGDEGKGTITEYLVNRHSAQLVVRYNGGAQAAHNIVTNDGRHHTFSQFGCGTLHGAITYLSRFMVIDPLAMLKEAEHLEQIGIHNPMSKVYVDQDALVILPYHRAANRLRELARGANRHGSCGVGVGEARSDFITYGYHHNVTTSDLWDRSAFVDKARFIQDNKLREFEATHAEWKNTPEYELLRLDPDELWKRYKEFRDATEVTSVKLLERVLRTSNVVFEGAQGVLLDEKYGFHPYTTWTDITFNNAETMLKFVGFSGQIERVGVVRSYMTRHGAGPMVTEDPSYRMGEMHNKVDVWQGSFREGSLDLPAIKYALDVIGGVDYIAMTHMDAKPVTMCESYASSDTVGSHIYLRNDGKKLNHLKIHNMSYALEYQTRLTEFLGTCEPHLTTFTMSHASFMLGAPVKLLSYGPTLQGKTEL